MSLGVSGRLTARLIIWKHIWTGLGRLQSTKLARRSNGELKVLPVYAQSEWALPSSPFCKRRVMIFGSIGDISILRRRAVKKGSRWREARLHCSGRRSQTEHSLTNKKAIKTRLSRT